MEVSNTTFRANQTASSGGAIALTMVSGRVLLDRVRFEDNQAANRGGAASLYVDEGAVYVRDSVFMGNAAVEEGGALRLEGGGDGGLGALDDVELYANVAGTDGGAIFIAGSSSQLRLKRGLLSGNRAGLSGGAVHQANTGGTSMTQVVRSVFQENQAGLYGGAVSVYSRGNRETLRVVNSSFWGNVSADAAVTLGAITVELEDASWGMDGKANEPVDLRYDGTDLVGLDGVSSGSCTPESGCDFGS